MLDCRLIAIPPADGLRGAALVELCRAAEAGGATSIQLRMKNTSAGELLAAASDLVSGVSIPVYVNDRSDVARLAGAAGTHLGADDLPPGLIRSVMPRPLRVGVSVGSVEEAQRAVRADADYWSLGPFASTASKVDAGPALGVEGFGALAALAPPGMPLIAIGGVTAEQVPDVLRAGGVGVAAISAIFGASDVTLATRRLREALDAQPLRE